MKNPVPWNVYNSGKAWHYIVINNIKPFTDYKFSEENK